MGSYKIVTAHETVGRVFAASDIAPTTNDERASIKHQENGALRAPADVAAAVLRIVGTAAITAGELYSVSDYGC